MFLLASGLSLNISKTAVVGVNCSPTGVDSWTFVFGCKSDSLPFSYLGFPLGGNHKTASFWDPVLDKMHKRLQKWKSLLISKGGRLTPAQSVLNSIPIYFMSILKAPMTVVNSMEKLMRDFI